MKSSLGTAIFSFLLRAYPRGYRARFKSSMMLDFQDRLSEVSEEGKFRLAMFWVATVFDVFRLAPAEHVRSWSARRHRRIQPANQWSRGNSTVARIIGGGRVAIRMVLKNPLSSTIAVVTIAFGIGLSVTTFSIVYGSTIRGLPFEEADELVHFERQNLVEGLPSMAVTPHDYVAWKEEQQSFEELAAFVESYILIRDDAGPPQPEIGVRIDAEAFDLLRVQPALGRLFSRDENLPGGPNVILLSHGLWQSRYGGDSSVIGQSTRVTDGTTAPHTIVGIMPEGFGFPILERFWLPLRLNLGEIQRGDGRLDVFGRLAPGVTFSEARSEFDLIADRLARTFPATNAGVEAKMATFQEEYVGTDFASRVRLMLAGSVFVLLIACANVSNLLMVRTVRRSKELALRTALGASRSNVAALILAESTLISVLGGILGLALAFVGVDRFGAALLEAGAVSLPHGAHAVFWWRFDVDLVPVAFAFALVAISATLAGLVPVVLAARTDVNALLKEEVRNTGSPRLRRLGHALVSLEVALAAGLLTATALTVKSLWQIHSLDIGFPENQIAVARVGLYGETYEDDAARRAQYWDALVGAVRTIPGASNVSLSSSLPMLRHNSVAISVPGFEAEDTPFARQAVVSPTFFATYNLLPVAGRLFTEQESEANIAVAVVNQSFVTLFFDGRDPVGTSILLGSNESSTRTTIVGVVPDSWMDGERNQRTEGVFTPLGAQTPMSLFLSVRSVEPGINVSNDLARVAAGVDPEQPIYRVRTMHELVAERTGRFKLYGTFYVVFGVTALAMALMGLYGVISFNVGQRTNEIGIRVALGADRSNVVISVLRQGISQVGVGLVFGVVLAVWISRGLESVLFQVESWDSVAFMLVASILTLTSLLACLIPARKAARVSPLTALRET